MTTDSPLDTASSTDDGAYARLVAQHVQRMATTLDRPDLAAALDVLVDRIDHPLAVALVTGPCDSGKTSFVDALLGIASLPVDLLAPTAVATVVSHGPSTEAVLNLLVPDAHGGDPQPFRRPIPLWEIPDHVLGHRRPGDGQRLESVSIRTDRALLADGVVLVDTPSLVLDAATTFVRGLLSQAGDTCDLVIYVADLAQELTRADLDFLQEVARAGVPVICVRPKIDLYPHWRRILQIDAGHLQHAGLSVPMFAVSSSFRVEALARQDASLNAASGFPAVVQHLRHHVLPATNARTRRRAVEVARSSLAQLTSALRTQRQVLADPSRSDEILERLAATERRTEMLKNGASLWRDRLQSGIEELQVEFEHDIRRRLSELQDRVMLMIEEGDPGAIWADLTAELHGKVGQTVVDSIAGLHERAAALTTDVARLFGDEEEAVLADADIEGTRAALAKHRIQDRLETESAEGGFGLGILAVRGSAGGLSVAALLTRFALVDATAVIFTPIVAVLALVMGKKALDSGRKTQVQARRRSAMAACKRYFDAVLLEVGKRSRQELLGVRSEVRAYLEERAQFLARKIAADRSAAESALRVQSDQVPAHLARIDDAVAQAALIDAHAARALAQLTGAAPDHAAQAVLAPRR